MTPKKSEARSFHREVNWDGQPHPKLNAGRKYRTNDTVLGEHEEEAYWSDQVSWRLEYNYESDEYAQHSKEDEDEEKKEKEHEKQEKEGEGDKNEDFDNQPPPKVARVV